MQRNNRFRWIEIFAVSLSLLVITFFVVSAPSVKTAAAQSAPDGSTAPGAGKWVVLAWNDLGMHCYNQDFQDLAVLPPYNTMWAQVIKVGDPPEIVTSEVTVSYSFADNTYSVGKSNFWTYAKALFGVDLAPNIGLTGRGLAGLMDAKADHFIADGIPLTEFRDSAPTDPYPYQLATIVARDSTSGEVLASTTAVAPVSTEMHCDNCHFDGGVEGIRTGRVTTNILTLHDHENAEDYPNGHKPLMQSRPVLCAECHASNALGAPGKPGIPNLSKAMHSKHAEVENGGDLASIVATALPDNFCYNCHPGPTTKCLRDIMSEKGMTCTDCHGTMKQVSQNTNPWLNEPRCDTCHKDPQYAQDQPLYRMSTGHGGVRCEGCHDSTHAIAQSSQPNDGIKFIQWQGHPGPVDTCTACHLTTPTSAGPHGQSSPWRFDKYQYLPSVRGGP